MVERTRRLRMGLANSSPGTLGATARPNYVGPSGNGLVERMNAGRKRCGIKGVREWAPLSVSRRRSRDLRKTPQWSAERRAGPRYGPAVPSRWRDRSDRKTGQRVRRSAPANFGAPLPSFWDCEEFELKIWHDSPPGCAARQRSLTGQQLA